MKNPALTTLEDSARGVGERVAEICAQFTRANPDTPRIGFALLLFDGEDWITYVSNTDRPDMLKVLDDFLAKARAGT